MRKLLITLIILFPAIVKANCTSSDMSRYKLLSSNINNYYEFNEETKSFDITLYNFSSELRVVDKTNNIEYFPTENGIGNIYMPNIQPGKTITIAIYPNNGDCASNRAYTMYVNTPYYNNYYTDPSCLDNDNILCSKWANTTNVTYEEFLNQVKKEKKQEQKEVEQKPKQKTNTIIEVIGKYYWIALLVIIVGGISAIYILDKKNKFDFKV